MSYAVADVPAVDFRSHWNIKTGVAGCAGALGAESSAKLRLFELVFAVLLKKFPFNVLRELPRN
jgi:hypothetical protein